MLYRVVQGCIEVYMIVYIYGFTWLYSGVHGCTGVYRVV